MQLPPGFDSTQINDMSAHSSTKDGIYTVQDRAAVILSPTTSSLPRVGSLKFQESRRPEFRTACLLWLLVLWRDSLRLFARLLVEGGKPVPPSQDSPATWQTFANYFFLGGGDPMKLAEVCR